MGIQSHGTLVPNTGAVLGSLELLVHIVVARLPFEFFDLRVIRSHLRQTRQGGKVEVAKCAAPRAGQAGNAKKKLRTCCEEKVEDMLMQTADLLARVGHLAGACRPRWPGMLPLPPCNSAILPPACTTQAFHFLQLVACAIHQEIHPNANSMQEEDGQESLPDGKVRFYRPKDCCGREWTSVGPDEEA